jgi:probable F420-dependent oxidoreductase
MRLGFRLPHFGPPASPEVIRSAAELAEASGWHAVWASDRVAVPADRPGQLAFLDSYVQTYETLVTLAFVAASTTHIRLGTSAVVVPQRQLMLLARQVASVDALSGGRMMLGVASGWAEAEFVAAGAGDRFPRRGKILDESIAALRALWTESPVAFNGRDVSFPSVEFAPRPVQAGGIPILVAGNSVAARRRAALMGDGWNPTALSAGEMATGMAEIRRSRLEHGRDGPFVSVGSLRLEGAPAVAREVLQPYADAGVDLMICAFTDSDAATQLAHLRAFSENVLPMFHQAA